MNWMIPWHANPKKKMAFRSLTSSAMTPADEQLEVMSMTARYAIFAVLSKKPNRSMGWAYLPF
jgi:hypothetical protein